MGFKSDFANNPPIRTEANIHSEGEILGLATTEALQRLHDDIETVLLAYEERYAKQRFVVESLA